MYYIFFAIKQKENKELSKDIFRVFQHKLSCHVPSEYSFVVDNKFMGRFCSSVSPCNENTCMEQWLHFGCKGPNLAVLIWEVGVSGVTAYKLTISLQKLKLAEDCFHNF